MNKQITRRELLLKNFNDFITKCHSVPKESIHDEAIVLRSANNYFHCFLEDYFDAFYEEVRVFSGNGGVYKDINDLLSNKIKMTSSYKVKEFMNIVCFMIGSQCLDYTIKNNEQLYTQVSSDIRIMLSLRNKLSHTVIDESQSFIYYTEMTQYIERIQSLFDKILENPNINSE